MAPFPIDSINDFVSEEGETVRHLTGLRCFCHNGSGQPNPNCTEHENGGWLYVEEHFIEGLITDISQRRELMETGVFMPGDCVFSPLTTETISEGDKIIFTWPLPFGQGDPLVRGQDDYDTLYYEGVKALYCIDEERTKYKQDVDFKLEGKQIVWEWTGKPAAGISPSYGAKYTVKYTAYIEWLVFVPPVERISHGEDLGSKVMLRKKHLIESR